MMRLIRNLTAVSALIAAVLAVGAFTLPDLVPQSAAPFVDLAVGGIGSDPLPSLGSNPSSVAACDHWCVESNLVGVPGTMCIQSEEEPAETVAGPFVDCANVFPDEEWCQDWYQTDDCIGCDPVLPTCGQDLAAIPSIGPSGMAFVHFPGAVRIDASQHVVRKACNGWVLALLDLSTPDWPATITF